jgi:hypothetical protein
LREAGKLTDAVRLAREAMAILEHPHVIRANAAEGAVLSSAVVLLESLAHELNVPGASRRDVIDALNAIRSTGSNGEYAEWVPYLEHSAAASSNRNAV